MSKLSRRGWLNPLFPRRRPAAIRRRPPAGRLYARLALERCEERTLPSSTIPLNRFGQVPQWTAIGPAPELNGAPGGLSVSGHVSGIAADPTNPDRLFVTAATGGIWRTLNATNPTGPSWTPLIDHLPASSFPAGLSPTQVDALRTLSIGAIAMAPTNANVLYATEPHGVLKTTNGGNTWTLVGNADLDGIFSRSIVVSSQDANTAFLSVEGGLLGGIWRTQDGGQTWTNISIADPVLGQAFVFTDVDVDPTNDNVVYASVGSPAGGVTNGIYRTNNARAANPTWDILIGGSTQLPGSQTGNIVMAIAPSSVSTLYASIAQRAFQNTGNNLLGVYRSNDSGLNWAKLTQAPDYLGTQAAYDNTLAVSPTNPNFLFLGGQTICLVSLNANATDPNAVAFTDVSVFNGRGPHVDHHAAGFDARGNVLDGNDGGIFRLNVNPNGSLASWDSLNGNNASSPTITALNTIQFNAVALHPRDPNIALGGSQDNGHARFNDNVGWQSVDGGDGDRVIFDYDNPLHALNVGPFISRNANMIDESNDGGLTWTSVNTGGIQNLNRNATLFSNIPLSIDPTRSQRFFFGTDVVNISEDGGRTWGQNYQYNPGINIAVPPTPSSNIPPAMGGPIPISAIAVGRTEDPTLNVPVLFVAHVDGTLYKIALFPPPYPPPLMPPATADWVDISPGGVVRRIIVDPATPAHPETLYVVTGSRVFRSTDAGASWTNITGDLPAGSKLTIAFDPRGAGVSAADDILYVGGSIGVFSLANPSVNTTGWLRVGGTSLPDVVVTDLQLNPTTGILAAGTYGRGAFEVQIRGLIRGQKFLDTNGNGVRDAGEPPVAGVTIQLRNATTGRVLASTVTDANGIYEFRSIVPGPTTATNFQVTEIPPGASVQTTAPPPVLVNFNEQSTLDIADPTLPPGMVTFGNFVLGTVSGVKFEDLNSNGVRDSGEQGLAGFTIYVDRNNNGVLDPSEVSLSAVTAANGTYTITGVGPDVLNGVNLGPNIIREIAPVGQSWMQTFPVTGFWSISLTSGQTRTGVNFGNIRPSSVAGGKFEDLNGNGVQDAGDPGTGGFTIQLINPANGSVLQTTVTAADGSYIFRSLPPGTYRVREVPLTGWVQTTANPADIVVGANQQITNIGFGNFHTLTVSGVKFDDRNGSGAQDTGEPGLGGFTFELVNTTTGTVVSTATSDAVGNFQFTGVGPLPAGSQYRVREAPQSGWVQTTANPAPFTPISSQNVTGLSFGNFRMVTISGTAYIDANRNGVRDPGEPGVPGFVIQLDLNSDGTIDQTAVTVADGSYGLSAGPGTHIVSEQPRRGFTLVSPLSGSYQVTVASGSNITGLDFGNVRRAVTVTANDADGPPTVTIRDATTSRPLGSFDAYDSRFTGGVRVAVGYFNGDQIPDIVTAPGPGGGPHVKVFDGATGDVLFQVMAYDTGFRGGVFVAAGDVNGDGIDDIITGAGASGGPHVKVFDGLTGNVMYSFFAYDTGFRGGVQVGTGDTDGDGRADIITGAGPGGGPHVKVFSGANLGVLASFFAYDTGFRGGVFVAAGDVNADGRADVITGPGAGGGSHVEAFDVRSGTLLRSFGAFTPASLGIVTGTPANSGARVASYDVDLDGFDDFIVSTGRGTEPLVRIFRGTDLSLITQFDAANPTFLGGIFVAGH